ncbi:16467_t:CDS:2 [Gigaspora margarita]|uniref:16467_t:CDS:1 n=1 Tax=Gigaspora margarita TaxID=4874 RepID=A0ABN7VYU8_GIGMA|nr:16467_t:CDS:2 [Gigaspora margarita]
MSQRSIAQQLRRVMKEMNNKNQTNKLSHSNSDEHMKKKHKNMKEMNNNKNQTNVQEHDPNRRAIAQQLRACEREARELVPSSEPITQFNRRKQERVEHERSEYEEVEHIRSEHERSEYERSAYEKNTSRTPENATNTPSKRSIAQQARRK